MRTRNTDTPKSTPPKKTPPAKKSATKTSPSRSEPTPAASASTPKSTETKRVAAMKAKQVKANESPTNSTLTPVSKPEASVEATTVAGDAVEVTPGTKNKTKTTRKVVTRINRRKTPASAKAGTSKSPQQAEVAETKVEELTVNEATEVKEDEKSPKKEESLIAVVEEFSRTEELVSAVEDSAKIEESSLVFLEESVKIEQPTVNFTDFSTKENKDVADAVEVKQDMEVTTNALSLTDNVGPFMKEDDAVITDASDPMDIKESIEEEEETEPAKEDTIVTAYEAEPENEPVEMEKDIQEDLKEEEEEKVQTEDLCHDDEKMDEDIGDEAHVELGEEELAEDDVSEHDEVEEALEEERAKITAAAEERKTRKEFEIFVGGLDRNVTEEDLKKAFENVGEVVEVRLHRDLSPNKNKGYAFVRFAKKEQAIRALAEMKNPVICGKRCGTAPSEDNDTLFLGNICNTWTKDAIRQKLKDYGVEGVGKITLVADPQHDGLSRGFAFIQFSCHPEAMLAFKRLQKPDVVFGHPERTAKVAFAEPLREPDPEVMAQVKSVFLDALPPQWDEDTVREQFKVFGEIERIVLARNMPTAKRKDFGFVDFMTRDAALACIEGVNSREFGDGKIKTRVRARMSNPLPKTQAVKGGMYGGFRIGQASGASFSKPGRGFGRGGQASSRPTFQRGSPTFQRGRAFYQHGHGQTSRAGFPRDHEIANPYPFRGSQNIGRGGRWDSFRGAQQSPGASTLSPRFDLDRSRNGVADRDRGRYMPIRGQPFLPEEEFGRPYVGRHFDEPYDDNTRGMKRPYFPDQDPGYVEPSQGRPRLEYSDPAISHPGTRYRGTGGGPYSRDYYGHDYEGGAYSSFYRDDRPYGGRYY